ncbi:hypothetical protein ACH50O_12065 [Methylomonas sp. 2BW1-5-20]|uniref:hypothetical protein n=1 Tax=Methylomonas sp. 2BW1-5-20 TaxID=3376686 RepID=UPI00404C84BB
MFRMAKIILLSLSIVSVALADGDWGEHHHHHHHRHHHGYPAYSVERVYVPERVVEYVPVERRYYAPPPPARYGYYDQRSPQGLVGGLVGSALGYEMGGGDPLAAGIGAAAGSWLGNGMNR